VRYSKQDRPFVRIARDGQLVPEAKAVIAVIAKRNLVMATGHSSAEEDLMLVREAKAEGVQHMVVTHAMLQPTRMSEAQMLEAVNMGAYIEFVYNGLIGTGKQYDFADYAKAIRYVGVNHCILSSDMGQPGNPLHTDGLTAFYAGLRGHGFTQAEIDSMTKENPARLIGLR
jgi:predicted metal-dependent phosphotriesterase family hydrolase